MNIKLKSSAGLVQDIEDNGVEMDRKFLEQLKLVSIFSVYMLQRMSLIREFEGVIRVRNIDFLWIIIR